MGTQEDTNAVKTPKEWARLALDSKPSECEYCCNYHNTSFSDPPSYHEPDPTLTCDRCEEVHFEHKYVDTIREAMIAVHNHVARLVDQREHAWRLTAQSGVCVLPQPVISPREMCENIAEQFKGFARYIREEAQIYGITG